MTETIFRDISRADSSRKPVILIIFIDCILLRSQTGFFYFPSNVTIHF
jgi:hypothetical protein